jgi:hypothetical protein
LDEQVEQDVPSRLAKQIATELGAANLAIVVRGHRQDQNFPVFTQRVEACGASAARRSSVAQHVLTHPDEVLTSGAQYVGGVVFGHHAGLPSMMLWTAERVTTR